ncbi:MAG: Hsp70 family protein [Armatimonadetes bacterium]|nr:Hsp70 family protein [Armatimonadota bacterium]
MNEIIVGIDLGTTNSEVAAFTREGVEVLGPEKEPILPSCVGIAPTGELLVGQAARHQYVLYPERTVRSVKRKMGTPETVTLGDKNFTPQEISALILRRLAQWGQDSLGSPVKKAVITVPAYFSDVQRQATREAGQLAGLEVVRILNEPTAASLAYGFGREGRHTALVYDLGGGTFDVSLVTVEGDVTEVLASHGNNRLGGDDFDQQILERLLGEFRRQHGVDLSQGHPGAVARLHAAAEEAKKVLSFEHYVTVREESLASRGEIPLHLELELSREEYEDMIRPLLESTLESVSIALRDAGKTPGDLDAVLLVGGSTRTPLVTSLLHDRTGIEPRQDVDPDLCVALGAGVLASRLSGRDVRQVLVDVSPYSFGPSYLGVRDGVAYPYCYRPIIRRNTPLPITRTERYATCHPFQDTVEFEIYQGEHPDALQNIPVGAFQVEGLQPIAEANEVLCRMSLDLDGILHVTAVEKCTGLSREITISNALAIRSEEEMAAAAARLEELYQGEQPAGAFRGRVLSATTPVPDTPEHQRARQLVEHSRGLLQGMNEQDLGDAVALHERIEAALESVDPDALAAAVKELEDLLFFVETV